MRPKRDWSKVASQMKDQDKKEESERLVNNTVSEHDPMLLTMPPLVKPLHGTAPRMIMGESWWNDTRQEVYKKNKFHCVACGVHKSNAKIHQWLEAHEYYEVDYVNTKYALKDIIPLCHCCHAFIHYQRSTAMLNAGKLSKKNFDIIMDHGKEVLSRIGVDKSEIILPEDHFPETNGKWGDWYFEFEGVKHYSKFENYDAWNEFYTNQNSKQD
jgi:hypothetical protein